MAVCRGIDVSAYQSAQDWNARKAEGVVFAFAKASEGQTSRDTRFATHITGIIKAGLIPGAYHFGWPTQDPAREAANYIAAVKPYARAGFVHWLDLERYSDGRNYKGRSDAQIREWVTTWLAAVRTAFPGQRVGVYTSADDIAKGHVPDGVPLWYPAYPWGAAAYSRAEAAAQPRPSGRAPLIWQFTSQPIDRSIAYLSAADLRAWAQGTNPEEPVALTPDDISKVADAVVAKLIAGGGVLENSDLDRIIDRDHVPAARPPYNNDDYYEADNKTLKNTTWKLGYTLQTSVETGRETLARVKNLEGAVGAVALSDAQVAALATQVAASTNLVDLIAEKVAADLAARLAE